MIDEPLLNHARRLWGELAGVAIAAEDGVVVSSGSLLCPPGWIGIVTLGGKLIATAPDESGARAVRRALDGLPGAALTDPAVVRERLPVAELLGPATLAYCDTDRFRPAGTAGVEAVPAAELGGIAGEVSADDAAEAGLDKVTSAGFVVREGGRIVAAAGYGIWPIGTAQLSVLTLAEQRGRGLARAAASAAVADALGNGLVPQWRARPQASRRVARALGFLEVGAQLSVLLRPAPGS